MFCGGVDAAVVQFSYMAPAANSGWRSWVRSSVLSYHTHDVRASVLADSTLVTGGREVLAKFGEKNAVVVCESSQVKSSQFKSPFLNHPLQWEQFFTSLF